MDTEPLLPAFRSPVTRGLVLAEAGSYDEGDGARAVMCAEALIVEMRVDGNEGQLCIPVVAILDAIQAYNQKHGS